MYTLHSITLHNLLEASRVQPRRMISGVTRVSAVWSTCLSLIFCKFLWLWACSEEGSSNILRNLSKYLPVDMGSIPQYLNLHQHSYDAHKILKFRCTQMQKCTELPSTDRVQRDRQYKGKWKRGSNLFYIYGSMHHNIFYEITNRCSYMQSILFHC